MDALAVDEKRTWSIDDLFVHIRKMADTDLVTVKGKEKFAIYSVDYETTSFKPLKSVKYSLTSAGREYLEAADKKQDSDETVDVQKEDATVEENDEEVVVGFDSLMGELDLLENPSYDKSNDGEFSPSVVRRILRFILERKRKGFQTVLREDIIAQLVDTEKYDTDCVNVNIEAVIDGGLVQYKLDEKNHNYRITDKTPIFINHFGIKFLDVVEDADIWSRAVEQTTNISNLFMLLYVLEEVSHEINKERITKEIKESIKPKEIYIEIAYDCDKKDYVEKARFYDYNLFYMLNHFTRTYNLDYCASASFKKSRFKDKDTATICFAMRDAYEKENKTIVLSRQLIKALNHKHPNAPFRFWQKCEKKRKQYLKAEAKKREKERIEAKKEQDRLDAKLLSYKGKFIDPDVFRSNLNRMYFDLLARSTEPCLHIKDIQGLGFGIASTLRTPLSVPSTCPGAKSVVFDVYGEILNDYGFVEWYLDWRKVLRDERDWRLKSESAWKLSKEICGVKSVTQNGIDFLHNAADEKLWNKAKKMCRGGSFEDFCNVLRFLNVKKSRSWFGRYEWKKALDSYKELEEATKIRYRKW